MREPFRDDFPSAEPVDSGQTHPERVDGERCARDLDRLLDRGSDPRHHPIGFFGDIARWSGHGASALDAAAIHHDRQRFGNAAIDGADDPIAYGHGAISPSAARTEPRDLAIRARVSSAEIPASSDTIAVLVSPFAASSAAAASLRSRPVASATIRIARSRSSTLLAF